MAKIKKISDKKATTKTKSKGKGKQTDAKSTRKPGMYK